MYTECNNELKLVVRRTDWSTSDLLYLFAEFYLFKSYIYFCTKQNSMMKISHTILQSNPNCIFMKYVEIFLNAQTCFEHTLWQQICET